MSLLTKYINEDKLNYKPTLIFPSCLDKLYGKNCLDLNDSNRMLKLEEEARAKFILKPNPDITDEERQNRRLNSHKPDYCGSCLQEQRFDNLKYCHNKECQRDPHYNPDNLSIGGESKTVQDYKPTISDWDEFNLYKAFMKMKANQ